MRGAVVELTAQQRVNRALYLAQRVTATRLDGHVRDPEPLCPDGFYLLKDHNGGKDPTAPDPFDRWTQDGTKFVNRTADCIGGASWIGGFDRYQPQRFSHIYSGWINTDSMCQDAKGRAKCFEALSRPEPGCFIVCASGSPGHKIGHIGTVVEVPAEWDPKVRECWKLLGVVDVASRTPQKANQMTTGLGWRGTGALFLRSLMRP